MRTTRSLIGVLKRLSSVTLQAVDPKSADLSAFKLDPTPLKLACLKRNVFSQQLPLEQPAFASTPSNQQSNAQVGQAPPISNEVGSRQANVCKRVGKERDK
eukprot:3404377-Amphidinium_carterae.1